MRQFFTLRFWLTIAALGGLALGVVAFVHSREPEAAERPASGGNGFGAGGELRTIDLVSWVYSAVPSDDFEIVGGRTTADLALILDGTRTMVVKAGTPGDIDCPRLDEPGQCTVAVDLLGDGVLWFSIVPGTPGATVQLPAVREILDDGWLLLANGWVVRHADTVDRQCSEEATSLADFIDLYGDRARATFSFEQQKVVKVTCPRAAGPATTTTVPYPTFLPPETVPVDGSDTTVAEEAG
ncbi:MAG: hypothetical protein Q7V88_18515 [Actinomycetota bacterium]|nr:hypothetical protein [Actinomycetota bacterium]